MADPPPPIHGTVDPAFAGVRAAFADGFTSLGEHGAAVCVIVDGRVVADLWGGWADQAGMRPWRADTLVNAFIVSAQYQQILLPAELIGDLLR